MTKLKCLSVAAVLLSCLGFLPGSNLARAESTISCPSGTHDMLDWMTMDSDLRSSKHLTGSANPLYTLIHSGKFYWTKGGNGYPWDIQLYDNNYIYLWITEYAWNYPNSYKKSSNHYSSGTNFQQHQRRGFFPISNEWKSGRYQHQQSRSAHAALSWNNYKDLRPLHALVWRPPPHGCGLQLAGPGANSPPDHGYDQPWHRRHDHRLVRITRHFHEYDHAACHGRGGTASRLQIRNHD